MGATTNAAPIPVLVSLPLIPRLPGLALQSGYLWHCQRKATR